jgi:glycosyltransferase involved in cell wall biosynthesis
MNTRQKRILIDAREFVHGRRTGIGRVLDGITDALAECNILKEIVLNVYNDRGVPNSLKKRENIRIIEIPYSFLKSEKALSDLSKQEFNAYISPYPKLPLFGCHCIAVHTVHDVLDLTHPAYRKRFKLFFDIFRLKTALKKADLTWYDSSWSMEETKRLAGFAGKNPRVRYLGIDKRFNPLGAQDKNGILRKYDLKAGYILVVGNGLPHKNLGVLLDITDWVSRQLVFVGVPEKNKRFWKSRYPASKAIWIQHINDEDLPAIMKGSFCIAQPSTAEGYGYPPLEAMACGIPAVVSSIPVLVETTGGRALTADPGDPEKWIEAFNALDNQQKYQSQVEKGLRWVQPFLGRKGWEKHVSDIEELIRGD